MNPEELIPQMLSDFLPSAQRSLDATSARYLAETAKIAGELGRHALRDECLNRVEAIVTRITPETP